MKPTTKIRSTEPQIAFVMRAHPNCNLDHLSELSFEFDQAGKIIDCIGTIRPVCLRMIPIPMLTISWLSAR